MDSKDNLAMNLLVPELSTSPLIIESIKEGGFGKVFIVSTQSGEKYALKILKTELGLNNYEILKEAEKLTYLQDHPNIAEIIGIYNFKDEPCIAMRYYPETLAKKMEGKLETKQVIDFLKQISQGLTFLHEKANTIHLDLKPQNILLNKDGIVSISDFGISVALPKPKSTGVVKDLFMSGIAGTITYMSPEQFTTHKVSIKTDVFSLGIILFEMLTGRHPFIDTSYERTVMNILTITPKFTNMEKVMTPKNLRQICLSSLEKNPINRPKASDIVNILSGKKSGNQAKERSYPIEPHRLLNKASSLSALGKLEEAQVILEEYIDGNPYDYSANINLAEVYYLSKDIEKAIQIAEKLLDISQWNKVSNSSFVTLLTNISNYYLSVDPEKSIHYSFNAIEIDPNDWQAWGNYAEGCRLLGSSKRDKTLINKGMEACLKAMELNSDDLKLKLTYGWLLFALEDFKTLSPYLVDTMNKYGGDNVSLRFLLIRTLIAVGQIEDAEAFLAPMRKYEELSSIVEAADRDLARKRMDV